MKKETVSYGGSISLLFFSGFYGAEREKRPGPLGTAEKPVIGKIGPASAAVPERFCRYFVLAFPERSNTEREAADKSADETKKQNVLYYFSLKWLIPF
ncbi:MAG: hypothetical protein MR883_03055 [Clostridiales bacterium]|nr:hypothetical protein [Clostridiales bacterium]